MIAIRTGAIFTGAPFRRQAPSDSRTASTMRSRSAVGQVRVDRQREHLARRGPRRGHVTRDDVGVLAVAVVVENNTRVIYAALHASRRELRGERVAIEGGVLGDANRVLVEHVPAPGRDDGRDQTGDAGQPGA